MQHRLIRRLQTCPGGSMFTGEYGGGKLADAPFKAVAAGKLAMDLGETLCQIGQYAAGFNGGQLIGIAHQDQSALWCYRLDQFGQGEYIDHGCFIHHNKILVEGVVLMVTRVRGIAHA